MNLKYTLAVCISLISFVFGDECHECEARKQTLAEGWSLNIGVDYVWMSMAKSPTYSGSTGGISGNITYQKPQEFFGQARTVYNLGRLSSSLNNGNFYEWYSEFVVGYCFSSCRRWSITPYVGVGFDFIHDNKSPYQMIDPMKLRYNLYYAVAGFDLHYRSANWMAGIQLDCLPTFNQYLRVKNLTQSAWVLTNGVGAVARLPIAYRCVKTLWMELAPYYRFFPIGACSTLGMGHRHINEYGIFLNLRYFL
jgi:hypothetical protein